MSGENNPNRLMKIRLMPASVSKLEEEAGRITKAYTTNRPFKRVTVTNKLQIYEAGALGLTEGQYVKLEFIGTDEEGKTILMLFKVIGKP